MAKKNYVLDTSVCLTDADVIYKFDNHDIFLPLKVLEEIVKSEIAIILSKNDTIVNSKHVIEKYNDLVEIKYIEGDHKLTEFENIFSEIEKIQIRSN